DHHRLASETPHRVDGESPMRTHAASVFDATLGRSGNIGPPQSTAASAGDPRSAVPSVTAGLQARAHELIPGGCHTYAKGDDQYPISAPGFLVRGSGCHVWDAEGREYIEYGMGNRAVGLGHAYPPVVEAVQKELSRGCNFTRPSPIEVEGA